MKNDLGAGISDLQTSIGDLRRFVADINAMDGKQKAVEETCERTRSMLEKMLQDMRFLQQASKDALSRLKSELESRKETSKKKRNSHGVERLLVANQKRRERERLQKSGMNSMPSRSNMCVRKDS